jgi:TP901 family phage tail tape measure protein
MSASDLTIAMILKLVDQVTKPAQAVIGTLKKVGAATENIGRSGVDWSNRQLELNTARKGALKSEALGIAATGFAFYQALKPAVEFEKSFSGVKKVLDFDSPQGLKDMKRDILALTTSGGLPILATDINAIVEAAGQAGVVDKLLPDDEERARLIAFATDAAKMGVAFDISAGDAGQAMAQWRKALKLTQPEALALGDAINHLSNNMNATAPGLVDIVRRQGAVAKEAGLAETETAALAAALLSGGASTEVAATGLKNFLGALTKGEAVTKRQSKVLKELGLDSTDLAKRMQVDAKGAIIEVMEKLAELPDYARSAALSQLFGEESKGAIAPLLGNIDLLREAFGLVADPIDYAGSMLAEYGVQAETTANSLILTRNYVNALAIATGSILLPEINALFAQIQPLIGAMTEWADAHPELVTLLFRVTAGLLAFKAASVLLRFTLFSAVGPILKIIRALSWMLVLLPRLAGGILALLNPLKLVRGSLFLLKTAFIATGIGALIAGIAMAGIWIYNNWEGLRSFFVGFWRSFREALGPAAPMLDAVIEYAESIWQWFSNILGPMDATEEKWLSWGMSAGEALGGIVGKIADWSRANSGLIGTIAKLYGWFLALRLVWRFSTGPIRAAGRVLAWVGTGPLKLLVSGVGLLSKAFIRLGILMLANPIGLVIASVAVLAAVVYANWDEIVSYFIEKVAVITAAFDDGLLNGVLTVLAELNPFRLMLDGIQGLIAYVMDLLGVPDKIVASFEGIDLWDTGVSILQSLWNGMASLVPKMVAAISAKLSGLIPAWMKDAWSWAKSGETAPGNKASTAANATVAPHFANRRDAGGPVRRGVGYEVGERGTELFVPGVSGSILPARVLRAAVSAAALAGPAAALPTQAEINLNVAQRPALQASAPVQQITRQGDTIHITIPTAPGQDAQAIAYAVRAELDRIEDGRRADLHDGGIT